MEFFNFKVNFQKLPRVSLLTTGITAGSRPTKSQSEREITLEVVMPCDKKIIARHAFTILSFLFSFFLPGYTKEKLLQLKEEEEKKILSDLKNAIISDEDMDLNQKNEQGATMVRKSD